MTSAFDWTCQVYAHWTHHCTDRCCWTLNVILTITLLRNLHLYQLMFNHVLGPLNTSIWWDVIDCLHGNAWFQWEQWFSGKLNFPRLGLLFTLTLFFSLAYKKVRFMSDQLLCDKIKYGPLKVWCMLITEFCTHVSIYQIGIHKLEIVWHVLSE